MVLDLVGVLVLVGRWTVVLRRRCVDGACGSGRVLVTMGMLRLELRLGLGLCLRIEQLLPSSSRVQMMLS